MKASHKGVLLFAVILIASFIIGSYILTAAFFGTLTLVGLVVLIESIPPLRWICARMSRVLDIILFALTIMATASYGLNIAASLTVAGLGYTLVYAPYLREQIVRKKNEPQPIGNAKRHFRPKQ